MSNVDDLVQAITTSLVNGSTFALFRIPDEPVRLWVERSSKPGSSPPAGSGPSFITAPFLPDGQAVHIRPDLEWVEGGPLPLDQLREMTGPAATDLTAPLQTEQRDYEDVVRLAQEQMTSGTLRKVVLSRTRTLPLERSDLPRLFLQAVNAHPSSFVAMVHAPVHGTWMGASPERLVTTQNGRLATEAVAGTMPLSTTPEDPSEWGEKERHEQALVTEAVIQALERCGATSIAKRPVEVLHQGRLGHLRTQVEAVLGTQPVQSVVSALHPTPAVCGTPREVALEFIRTHERHDRGLYAGYWGIWHPEGRTELFVNIRCLRVFGNRAVLYAGAGITPGSDPEQEWWETERKTELWAALMNALHRRAQAPSA